MMGRADYWEEAVSIAFDEAGAYPLYEQLTKEQRDHIGASLEGSAEHQSMAFYTPPASDRLAQVERDWKAKYDALRAEFDAYQNGAESAMRRALRTRHDANLSINTRGEVFRHDGRTEQIL